MHLKNKLTNSAIISFIALLTAITIPLTPCRVAPAVPNPTYQWSFCSLNPDLAARTTSIKEFFGYTTSFTDAYFLLILIIFLVAMIFFHYTMKNK